MNTTANAYLVGEGIGSLAAAFMIRDGNLSGEKVYILQAGPDMGGSLDGAGNPDQEVLAARRTHADHR